MSVSFSSVGGSFVITDSDLGIVYSSDTAVYFKKFNDKIQVFSVGLANSGSPLGVGNYALSDITTIGGNAVAGTLDEAINQLNLMINNGQEIYPENLDQTLVYNVDGTLNYIQVVSDGSTYRQTFGYTDGNVTSISKWTLQ